MKRLQASSSGSAWGDQPRRASSTRTTGKRSLRSCLPPTSCGRSRPSHLITTFTSSRNPCAGTHRIQSRNSSRWWYPSSPVLLLSRRSLKLKDLRHRQIPSRAARALSMSLHPIAQSPSASLCHQSRSLTTTHLSPRFRAIIWASIPRTPMTSTVVHLPVPRPSS